MDGKIPEFDELAHLRARVAELERALEERNSSELGRSLLEREALLQEAERISHLGSWVWDANGGEVVWSDELYRILGYDPAQVRPSAEAFFARIHPDDLALVVANGQKVAAGGSREGRAPDRARVLRPDGELRHIEVDGRVISNSDGSPARVVGIIRDITDALATREALDDALMLLAALGHMDGLGTWIWHARDNRVEWSQGMYQLLGEPRDAEPSVERFMSHVHPDDLPQMALGLQQLASNKSRILPPMSFRLVQGEQVVRHILVQSHVLSGPESSSMRVAGIMLDITERHTLETQLRQSQKMEAVGVLAGGVAHDVNNYLTVALGNSELLSMELPDDHEGQALLSEIIDASQSCRLMLQRLLAFSRRQLVAPTVFELDGLLRDFTALARRLVGDDITVTLALGCGDACVRSDRTQIEQVLVNLVINARDAMSKDELSRRGGHVTISSRPVEIGAPEAMLNPDLQAGSYLCVAVGDDGPGIPPELQQRIFEPFFSTKREEHGTGLGLSTAFGIVRQSGGAIRVHSEPGHGATFEVYLPMTTLMSESDSNRSAPRTLRRGQGTILLIEDDEPVRRAVKSQLERGGYHVLDASCGDEALSKLAAYEGPLDLLITDVVMPVLSGPMCAKRVRELRPNLPVGFISGYATDRLLEQADIEHAGVLQKPFTIHTLLDWVADLRDEPIAPQ